MQIKWTRQAEASFNSVIDYLLEAWTTKEAHNFIDLVENIIFQISENPKMFKVSKFDSESREAVITKQTVLFYRILTNNTIEIEYFWNSYQNPNKQENNVKNK